MKGRRALRAVVLLALVGVIGIIGMLLTEGAWNATFFVLAALPLAAGAWWRWRQRVPAARGVGPPP